MAMVHFRGEEIYIEDRFIPIGKEDADYIRENNPGVSFPENLDIFMAREAQEFFIAEMCDDYSITLQEQDDIKKCIVRILGNVKVPYQYRLKS